MKLRSVISLLALSVAACGDTEPPKGQNNLPVSPNRLIDRVVQMGVMPVSCDGATDQYELPLLLIGDDFTPVRGGESLSASTPEEILSTAQLENSAMAEATAAVCGVDTCVNASFTCSQDECAAPTSMSLSGQTTFSSTDAKGHLFVVLMENSGSLDGWLPEDVGELYADWDGDGLSEAFPDLNVMSARASDRTKSRIVAISRLLDSWGQVMAHGQKANHNHLFGHWYFSGDAPSGVKSLIEVGPDSQVWTSDSELAQNLLRDMEDAGPTRANVYQAASTVLEGPMATAEFADYEKTVLLLVDGPDDLRSNDYDSERVIQSARAIGAQIHMVQLDTGLQVVGVDGTPTLRDDPAYLEDQSPCQTDGQCQNFEECRRPIGYSTSKDAPVEITTEDSYCLPSRDASGRVGPIAAYQAIACETGGSYQYVKNAPGLPSRVSSLPFATYGVWKVPVTADFGSLETGAYRISADLSFSQDNRPLTVAYSQSGDPFAASDLDSQDNRAVVFNP